MSMQIVQAKNFDVDSVTFSDPRVNTYGGKSVYLNYNRKPLVIQTEELICQWGLTFLNQKMEVRSSMDLSFRGFETNPKIQTLLINLKNSIQRWLKQLLKILFLGLQRRILKQK